MFIDGKRYLNANNYKKIIINYYDNNYRVKVKKDKTITDDSNISKLTNKFTDYLKYKSNDEQILSIIEHFCYYSTINSISNTILPYYNDLFVLVEGLNKRELSIQILSDDYNTSIIDMLTKKYQVCRDLFIKENENINEYFINTNNNGSRYSKDEGAIYLDVHSRLGIIDEYESEFLKNLLYEKFIKEGVPAYIETENIYNSFCKVYIEKYRYIKCGNVKIILGDKVIEELLTPIINSYNESYKNKKVKQLKMEEF